MNQQQVPSENSAASTATALVTVPETVVSDDDILDMVLATSDGVVDPVILDYAMMLQENGILEPWLLKWLQRPDVRITIEGKPGEYISWFTLRDIIKGSRENQNAWIGSFMDTHSGEIDIIQVDGQYEARLPLPLVIIALSNLPVHTELELITA